MPDRKVKTLLELNDAIAGITSVLNPPGDGMSAVDKEQEIWRAYLMLEKNVALMRLELGVENPGEFIKDESKSREPSRYLRDALSALAGGIRLLDGGESARGWRELRLARNDLRFYLREVRRLRLRTARSKKPAPS